MVEDICPYVFCSKCKNSNSWVRHKARDVVREGNGGILWKGWQCKNCGETALEPTGMVKNAT